MKNQLLIIAAGFIALWTTSCAPARQLSIQGAYKPGQQISYRLTEHTVTQTEALEGEMEIPATTSTQEKITDFNYTVKAVRPDNSIDLELKFTRVQDREADDKGETEYDTDQPIPDSLINLSEGGLAGKALAYNTLIGRSFQMRLSQDGKVLSVKGMNDAWDEIEQRFMEQSPLAGSMLKNMKKQFGDEAMRSGQNDYWGYLPGKKVRVGQTWKKPYEFACVKKDDSASYFGGFFASAKGNPFDFSEFERFLPDGTLDVTGPVIVPLGGELPQAIVCVSGVRSGLEVSSPLVIVTNKSAWRLVS